MAQCSAGEYKQMEAGFNEIALTQKVYKDESVHKWISEMIEL